MYKGKGKRAYDALLRYMTMDHFCPEMPLTEINKISMLGLAHVGDAVYELLTRTMLCRQGHSAVARMHKLAVSYVNAPAQARAAEKILPRLTDAERDIYRRGRNAKVHSVPQHADLAQYHAATGLEVLFGWLYLQGKTERVNDLFTAITQNGGEENNAP